MRGIFSMLLQKFGAYRRVSEQKATGLTRRREGAKRKKQINDKYRYQKRGFQQKLIQLT
jgi:hypothetical protein